MRQTPTTTRLAVAGMAALLVTQAGCSASDDHLSGSADTPYYPGPEFQDYGVNPEVATAEDNRSTFALDVDTGSYTITRARLAEGYLPDPESVRTEEFVNYFAHDYEPPADGIGTYVDGMAAPFLGDSRKAVVRVGLQAAVVDDANRKPANLTFIVDTSGSMAGHNLEMVTAGLGRLVDSLRPDDRVAIVTFSTDAELKLAMTPMTEQAAIRTIISGLAPQSSTNLEAGLRLGYQHALAKLRPDGINRVILLSDGEANEGQTDPQLLADQIAQEAGRNTQIAVIGVGRQTYNEAVLEQFANNGNGSYSYIDTVREAERLFVHDLTGTLQAVALDAKVQVTFNLEAVSHFRLLGYENRQLDHDDLRDDTADGGEIGAGHTATALYEVTLPEGSEPLSDTVLATVDAHWIVPDSGESVDQSATLTVGDLASSPDLAPVRLWQDVLVAAFAESLRGAPWSEQISLAQVADGAQVLANALPGDEQVAEFAELTRRAVDSG